jgi:hypothetical protein
VSDHCKTFQRLRAGSALTHKRASRPCANASRIITTFKSLQRQVLRATIVVTSPATVTRRNYSRIGSVAFWFGVLRSSTRTAGWGENMGALDGPAGARRPHTSSARHPIPVSPLRRRPRRSIAGSAEQRPRANSARSRSPTHAGEGCSGNHRCIKRRCIRR